MRFQSVLKTMVHETKTDPRFSNMKNSFENCKMPRHLTLEEFLTELPKLIKRQKARSKKSKSTNNQEKMRKRSLSEGDEISDLFSQLVFEKDEWERFALSDSSRNYSRNLIATDNETYTLLLLCWNPGKSSPIHDHPCDGCWMRVCEGEVMEARYAKDENTDSLRRTSDNVYHEGEEVYISDYIGYHKIGNPSPSQPAVTLHLYCPPFQRCKIWLDPEHFSKPTVSSVCFYSEFGMLS